MKQRYNEIDHDLCVRAVLKYLDHKWKRPDVLREIACYVGISRRELKKAQEAGSQIVKMEAAEALAYELENRVETLRAYGPEAVIEELDPVEVTPRKDGMTGKVRDVAYLCFWHQALEFLAVMALRPLLDARITPWQHASIPKHGDARLRRQTARFLRSGNVLRYAVKRDVHHAYGSTRYEDIIRIVEKEIPDAKDILALMTVMERMAPGGHLIIGGYLDAWLFNLAMSYAVRYVLALQKAKRGQDVRLVRRIQAYMDDIALFGTRLADINAAARKMESFIGTTYHLRWGPKMPVAALLTVKEERARKRADKRAGRGCPALDMGGWLFARTHITVRGRIYRLARRCVLRCLEEIKRSGTVNWQRARRYMSYYGRLRHSPSRGKYPLEKIKRLGGWAIAWHERPERSFA